MSSRPSSANCFNLWEQYRGKIRNTKGGWILGEAIYNHGFSMMDELVGHTSYFQVLILNITGRLPEKNISDWTEASFICLSWPDPRIWCNKIGALAGTSRTSSTAAVSAGTLAADSRMYASGAMLEGAEFIISALNAKNNGTSTHSIVQTELARKSHKATSKAAIMGYARPLATGDERVVAMERVRNALNFPIGPHLRLAFEIENLLMDTHNECMNILGYCAAFMADQGFTATEITRIYSLWVSSGIHACYAEYCDRPPGTFLPLRCDDIDYQGKAPRPVPERNKS